MIFGAFGGLGGRVGIPLGWDSRFAQRSEQITHFARQPSVRHPVRSASWPDLNRSCSVRPLLALRGEEDQGCDRGELDPGAVAASGQRDDSPVPSSAADVMDLVLRLRGHVCMLGVLAAAEAPEFRRAQQLASESVPVGYMDSRGYLLSLAEAARDLVAGVRTNGSVPQRPPLVRRRWSGINALRGAVFITALVCLILAASTPQS
jgi:hypothetical protein